MNDINKIEIAQIKDLKLIFFYDINEDLKGISQNKFFGLKIVYGDDQILDYNYTYKYFKEFVLQVIYIYEKEKDLGNISFLSQETKDFMQNISTVNFQKDSIADYAQENSILATSSRDFQIRVYEDYIKDISFSILSLFHKGDDIKINRLYGYRNRYFVEYNINKKIKTFPMIIIKKSEDRIYFEASIVNGSCLNLSGELCINDGSVSIAWSSNDKAIVGKHFYSLKEDANQNIIKYNDRVIHLEQNEDKIDDNAKDKIDFYMDLFTLDKIDKGIMTIPNTYFLTCSQKIKDKHIDNLYAQKSCHIIFKEQMVHILYSLNQGLSKYDGSLLVPIHEEKKEIIILPFDVEDDKYVLVEKHYIPQDTSIGEYKDQTYNKYFYKIFKVKQNNDLTKPIEIIDAFNIENDINSANQAIAFVKKRGTN